MKNCKCNRCCDPKKELFEEILTDVKKLADIRLSIDDKQAIREALNEKMKKYLYIV